MDVKAQLHDAQQTAVALVIRTGAPDDTMFDFFLVHVLTSSHAIRILLPLVPARFHVNLLRQWWLFALAVYIAQTRPEIRANSASATLNPQGRDWKYVVHTALAGPWSKDAHFVKGKEWEREMSTRHVESPVH